jgi:hypothetical protein
MEERLRMITFVFYAMLYLEDLIAMDGSLQNFVGLEISIIKPYPLKRRAECPLQPGRWKMKAVPPPLSTMRLSDLVFVSGLNYK